MDCSEMTIAARLAHECRYTVLRDYSRAFQPYMGLLQKKVVDFKISLCFYP
jgi:hypothetical protein